MARLDVYANPEASERKLTPYFMDLQNNHIDHLATRVVVPAAMEHFRLHRVHAGVFAGNPASMRVLERVGFQRDGVLPCAVVKRGELLDVHVYSVVRRSLDEPPAMNPSPWRGEGQGRGWTARRDLAMSAEDRNDFANWPPPPQPSPLQGEGEGSGGRGQRRVLDHGDHHRVLDCGCWTRQCSR